MRFYCHFSYLPPQMQRRRSLPLAPSSQKHNGSAAAVATTTGPQNLHIPVTTAAALLGNARS